MIEFADRSGADRYDVVLERPEDGWESWRRPSQPIIELTVPIEAFAATLRRRLKRTGWRTAGWRGSNADVACWGRRQSSPGRGSRPGRWNLHRAAMSAEEIAREYPGIAVRDVAVAIEHELIRPTSARGQGRAEVLRGSLHAGCRGAPPSQRGARNVDGA